MVRIWHLWLLNLISLVVLYLTWGTEWVRFTLPVAVFDLAILVLAYRVLYLKHYKRRR